jgi:hypothetical protein
VEVNLEDFLSSHTASDEHVSLFTRLITGEGDQGAVMAELMESMMGSIALFFFHILG